MEVISNSRLDTKKIAHNFLASLGKVKHANASVVGLHGDLGAGKTTFVQYVARELGVKRKVSSPTFLIIKRYSLKHKVYENLFHIDAYRLKNEKEIIKLGIKEILKDKTSLVLIEWPENIKKIMPKKHTKVYIEHFKKNKRKILINI